MRRLLTALPVLILLAAGPSAAKPAEAPKAGAVAAPDILPGTYKVDLDHSTVIFRVDHIGMSNFTAQFRDFTGALTLDPVSPEASSVTVDIDVTSLQTPVRSIPGFDKTLTGPDWLDGAAHPKITFKSTRITRTGPDTADITGDFTLKGVTRPIVLKAKFNGGWKPNAYDGARVGFSATTSFKRSDFGIAYGVPAPGTRLGVSDEVQVAIETEWSQGKPTGEAAPSH
ncbi:YceI family protein [Caulobacter sp. NIBR1757]|uniref:YceI family protein n=1 Tax=Caulobacter sp. NIBR1757 TaxID=3016000 RepID=UPI0022F0E76D|nr:YceI family protein [Caulobacter sp. NIBR1757]WGM40323.1 Protein YceI [Caulobacter sp. NIBR1757]